MEKYDKILVCLDQSHMDEDVIHAASKICDLEPSELTFINVMRDFTLPEELKREFPDFLERAIEERRQQIQASITKHFTRTDLKIQTVILQDDSPAKAIIMYGSKCEIDLIIAGRKKRSSSSGVLMNRLARRAECSFLMVAERRKFDFKHILVPIDFSEHSALALRKAIDFAQLSSEPVEIYTQNVYSVPSGYHYTGKSLKEFAQIMKENAIKSYNHFMKDIDTGNQKIKAIFSLNDNGDFVTDIKEQAARHKTELIIIGARGQTAASTLFIGNKSERIVMMHTDASMLVVRKKGDKAGLRDLIQEL